MPGERDLPAISPWVAFSVLGVTTASHTVAETARDAVFLASVPAERLPWMYVLVGVCAVLALRVLRSVHGRFRPGTTFAITALSGAMAYGALYLGLAEGGSMWQLVLMYVLSSVLGSVLVVQFWTVTSSQMTMRTAKQQFAFIGAGSVAGAIAGSAAAAGLSVLVGGRGLLLVAAVGFVVAGLIGRGGLGAGQTGEDEAAPSLGDGVASLREHPYPRYVAAIVVLAAIVFTLSDYVFKASIAASVAAEDLASVFAVVYLGLNIGSLLVQLALVRPLVNRVPLNITSAMTPLLTGLAAVFVAATGAVWAAVGLRAVDGLFKHSMHRTVTELLYVPMRPSVRPSVKRLVDVVGHRGGQIVASFGVLLLIAAGGGVVVTSIVLIAATLAWVAVAIAMREPYLDLFRSSLMRTYRPTSAELELDLASVETLVAALNSPEPTIVCAAVDLLFEQGKGRLVPPLILHHPEPTVVIRAAHRFAASGRTEVLPVIRTVATRTEDPTVLSALVRARLALKPDLDHVRATLEEDRPGARAVAAAHLLTAQGVPVTERQVVAARTWTWGVSCRTELLETMAALPGEGEHNDVVQGLLVRLMDEPMPVGALALEAMGSTRDVSCLPIVVGALVRRELVTVACRVLVRFGEDAAPYCARALADTSTPQRVRMELAGVMAEMGPEAVDSLRDQLMAEPRGSVAYRVLLALERHGAGAGTGRQRDAQVVALVEHYLSDAERYRRFRAVLQRPSDHPGQQTRAHGVLVRIVREKQLHAIQRATRVYGVSTHREDFASISAGLGSPDAGRVASSLELLDGTVGPRFRGIVRAARSYADGDDAVPASLDYDTVLGEMQRDDSRTLVELAKEQGQLIEQEAAP